jgi:anaerobic selenocysteine-containing dehydrogenase
VRALLCIGGNPIVAWPDQAKTVRAIDDLELFTTVDVKMSASAQRADYVIAPQVSLEREDVTLLTDSWYERPYSHYTRAVVDPDPETMDVMEEWEFYWELARRLGTPIPLSGGELDLDEKPSKLEVLQKMMPQTRVPVAEIREHRGGHVYEQIEVRVGEAKPGAEGRLQLAPDGICDELREVRAEPVSDDAGYAADTQPFSHRLISRRLKHVYNSSGQELPALAAKGTTNPAYMNPADIAALGLASGDLVEIASASGAILAVAEATDEVLPGVISMAHAWGATPERDSQVREIGSSTNRLVDNTRDYDPISGMARQSAIPVNLSPVTEAPRSG